MKKTENIIVSGCYHECEFFGGGGCMECDHPYFDKFKDSYARLIIDQDNCRDGNIPPKCPLRKGAIELITKVRLSKKIKL